MKICPYVLALIASFAFVAGAPALRKGGKHISTQACGAPGDYCDGNIKCCDKEATCDGNTCNLIVYDNFTPPPRVDVPEFIEVGDTRGRPAPAPTPIGTQACGAPGDYCDGNIKCCDKEATCDGNTCNLIVYDNFTPPTAIESYEEAPVETATE